MVLDSIDNPIDNPQKPSPASERQSSDWDVKNAPKNYISLVFSQGGSVIFAFASVWLLTRVLRSDGYGSVVAIIAASQVAQVLVNWTSFSIVRFGVDEFVETQKIARTFWVRFSILIVNMVLAVLAAQIWYPPLATALNFLPETYWLVFAHFCAMAFWIHVQLSLQGAKMAKMQGFLLMIERIIILTLLIVSYGFGKLYPITAIFCYVIASSTMAFVGLIILRHYIWSKFTADFEFYKKIVVYSLPLLPFTLVGYFSSGYIDTVFISKFLSIPDVGVYSVAAQMNGIVMQLPTLANSLLIPLFITLAKENQSGRIQRYFADVLPTMTLFWGALCALAAFVGYYTLQPVFGDEFAKAIEPLWILVAAAAVSFPVLVGYSALSHAVSDTYVSMYAAIFSAAANIILNFLLIPKYGMIGCAWATVLAYSVSVISFALLLRRSQKISLSWIPLSLLPAIAAAITYTFTHTAYWALLACAVSAGLIALMHKTSIIQATQFLRNQFANR